MSAAPRIIGAPVVRQAEQETEEFRPGRQSARATALLVFL